MVNHKRRKRLLKMLAERHAATVPELVDWLSASPATVRRDIGWLAARNLQPRTRGGAEHLAPQAPAFAQPYATFAHNLQASADHRRGIARYASTLCSDGDTIIVNGGTTAFMMAEFLADKHLKILTNSFLMAERLLVTSSNDIILPGGTVYRDQNVILSPFDNDITQHHYASKMFTGVHGLSLLGLMEADPLLLQAEQRLPGQAEELIVLADSSKFVNKTGFVLCGLNRVATVVTDTGASDAAVQLLEQAGVRAVTVAPDAAPAAAPAAALQPVFPPPTGPHVHVGRQH